MQNTTIKLIELDDAYVNRRDQYPYIHSIKSQIRFRLRSKITFDHQPIILIDKLTAFDYLLPLQQPLDIETPQTQDKFIILRGSLADDGAWIAQLPEFSPGVISFQVVFVPEGTTVAKSYGTHDIVLLCQDKYELRKLRKMTVFARCIGRSTEWQEFFNKQYAIGYNAFHLAPIQQTGASNSYYSLKNHLQLSSQLFSGTTEERYQELHNIFVKLKQKGIVFFIDIILNHTSFDSDWVKDSPDACFTSQNTPMLYTAFLVDQVISQWGEEVKDMMSFDVELTEDILTQIQENLLSRITYLKLYEYFQLSDEIAGTMLAAVKPRKPSENIFAQDPIEIIESFLMTNSTTPNHQRKSITVKDISTWADLNLAYEETDLKTALQTFNLDWKNKIQNYWIPQIVKTTIDDVRHNYYDNSYRRFDDPWPLVNKYFSKVKGTTGDFFAINNGWVSKADSREIFVTSKQYFYLRRKVNVWGDLLRIRYGEKPSDSPAAWDHMLDYVRIMAKHFDGFRMDNLHGTQISVARYMIREARRVNPNLIVFAELFTSSDEQTAVFVKEIGINSVLKQSQHMLSGDSFVWQFHNRILSQKPYLGALNRLFIENGETIKYSVRKQPIILVYDLTHDNQTFITKNIHILQTPISFLLSLSGTFTGSTKGFDQFYSKKIDVTQLRNLYTKDIFHPPVIDKSTVHAYLIRFSSKVDKVSVVGSWNDWKQPHALVQHSPSQTYYTTLYLPPGHYEYKFKTVQNQWFLQDGRPHNSNHNHEFWVNKPASPKTIYRDLQQLRKHTSLYSEKFFTYKEYFVFHIGNIVVIIREPKHNLRSICVIANLSVNEEPLPKQIGLLGSIESVNIWLQSGLSIYEGLTTQSEVFHSSNIHQFFEVNIDPITGNDILKAPFIPAGFACLLQCSKNNQQSEVIEAMNELISRSIQLPPMGPIEYNTLLFGCNQEQEDIYGQSNYVVPQSGYKQIVYAGFAGVYHTIIKAKKENSLGEGLFENLRQGNWLFDYYLGRLRRYKHLVNLVQYLQRIFNLLSQLPKYLIPKYFTDFMYKFVLAVEQQTAASFDFKRKLVIATSQFINYFPKCDLPFKILISAGLPHFSVGWTRCWGRDTFTCTDLLLLHPHIMKDTIIQFASALRHGLIPNLLDEGKRPRYNSRDACWWFLRSIAEYLSATKDYDLLKSKVDMIFLSNDIFEHNQLKRQGKKKVITLQEVVQQIFQAHANGISFRQWYAGYQIDSNMTTDGFNIHLQADFESGFIIGGNGFNCLTWMDKMGSSNHANTKGIPSTPRAGAPVELIGLLYSSLQTFQQLYDEKHYSFEGVIINSKTIKFSKWADKIRQNFQYWFYLEENPVSESTYVLGIYKDLVGSPLKYDQQRFRPNALIALAVAPGLFNEQHAQSYIKKVETHLLHPKSIGVATLANVHTPFVPYYDNSDDSSNPKVAHGFSYHNGPQWVWLYGFYIVAKIKFSGKGLGKKRAMSLLQEHIKYLQNNEWCSLPEITNKNGEINHFSCHAQAWSISSILMALKEIESLTD